MSLEQRPRPAPELVYLIVDGLDRSAIEYAYTEGNVVGGFRIMPGVTIELDASVRDYLATAMPTALAQIDDATTHLIYPLFRTPLPARFSIDWLAPEREHPDGLGIVATIHALIDCSKKHQSSGLELDRLPTDLPKPGDRIRVSYCPETCTGGLTRLEARSFVVTSRSHIARIQRDNGRSIYLVSRLADTHPVTSAVDWIAETHGAACRACPYYTDAHPRA